MLGSVGNAVSDQTNRNNTTVLNAAAARSDSENKGKKAPSYETAATNSNSIIEDSKTSEPVNPISTETFTGLITAQSEQVASETASQSSELTEEEEQEVQELKQTDQQVRQHEQAHKTVGGPYAGEVELETITGPDGREYAVAGEVDIDVSPIPNNPAATIRKAEIVERAALAPAEPSSQDIQVARKAQQMRIEAQQELNEQRRKDRENNAGVEDNIIFQDLEELLGTLKDGGQTSLSGSQGSLESLFSTSFIS